jgi:hypothetical protein
VGYQELTKNIMNYKDKAGTPIEIGDTIKICVDESIVGEYTEYHGTYCGTIVEHEMFGVMTPVFESLSKEPQKCLVLPMSDMKYGELQTS